MERTEWLNRLEALHVRRRDGEALPEADLAWYRTARSSLLTAAVEIQARMSASDGPKRTSIRVSRPVQVLLEAAGWHEPTVTVDLSTGGFAALLEAPPPVSEWIKATLILPGGPLVATVSVVDQRASAGLVRLAFAFAEPSEALRARVEDAMVDGLLEQLVFWDDVLAKLEG
jgi:hypothetical protein